MPHTPQWELIRDKVSMKLIIIPSGDQDGTYANHEPKVRINGPPEFSVRPGSTVRREGEVSYPRSTML